MQLSDVSIVQTPVPDLVELRYERELGGRRLVVSDCVEKGRLQNIAYIKMVLGRMQHEMWRLEREMYL